jgi:crotonobetainyl-CoA:carnitine CoA-transferase CaiB-like acyl-CoA transferase
MACIQSATPTLWSWFGHVPHRPALSNALRCRDGGFVGLLVRPATFEGFRAWVAEAGIPTQLGPDDAHWAELTAPRENNPISKALLELAAVYDRDAFADRAAQAETICLPVMDFPSMLHHPQFTENREFGEVEHPELGERLGFPRSPVVAVDPHLEVRRAPLLGEHTRAVLVDLREPQAPELPPGQRRRLDPYRALEGVRVVDLCWVLAGPLGTRLLASFGADVIRIESSRHIDGMRSQLGPDGKPDRDLGGLFNTANAGKRSLTVDLMRPEGRELVLDLVERADVVTNNFRAGALERMGLGYEVLSQHRADVVLLNLPGTHAHGPWSSRPTTGNAVMAASGMNSLMGFPGQRPRGYGVAFPDFTSPYLLAIAVLAALRLRERTGEGRVFDLSQLSATVSLLGPEWMRFRVTGEAPRPAANRHAALCPHGVFPAAGEDQWIAIEVDGDADFERLCTAMGSPELAHDPRFVDHGARKRNEDALDAILSAWTAGHERFELAAELQAAGVAAAPVEDLADTYERDPQLRDHYQRVRHPGAPEVELPIDREIVRCEGVPHSIRRGPIWGEHNEEIVREVLGRSEEEYVELVLNEILV